MRHDLDEVDLVGWISTAALARLLGKRTPRAGRDWCRRHGIVLRRDGKVNWARTEDVRRALDGLATDGDGDPVVKELLHRRLGGTAWVRSGTARVARSCGTGGGTPS
jgi:hypothetical protein